MATHPEIVRLSRTTAAQVPASWPNNILLRNRHAAKNIIPIKRLVRPCLRRRLNSKSVILAQVDTQFDRSVRRKFLGPAYDELLRVVVEILFNERRRVHRIEELVRIAQFQAYGVRVRSVCRGSVRE